MNASSSEPSAPTPACSRTASGVPLRLLGKQINGVRVIGIDVPGFGIPTHAEAKDVLAGAMLNYARREAELGPVQAPRAPRSGKPTISLLGEMFPVDPVQIGGMLDRLKIKAKRARYVGRPASASTAAGLMTRHLKELETFLTEAFA